MTARIALLACVGVLAASRPAMAQDPNDVAAWFAMMATPYGALPPAVTPRMHVPAGPLTTSSFELRFGRFAFERSTAVQSFGIGARFGRGGLIAGYQGCSGCDGSLLLGVEFDGALAARTLKGAELAQTLTLGVRPALGYGLALGGGSGSALSATLDFPISLATQIGGGRQLAAFVSPGYGYGRLSGRAASVSGTRGSVGAGIAVINVAPGLGLSAGWRKIFLQDAPSSWGIGLTLGRDS